MTSVAECARGTVYRFDRFELLTATEELRKRGTRIHLPPQPFRVLLMLVERAGEIVTREEIQEALWGSETFVDFEQGINTAIRRIRFALHDNAETPRFLQTLPRKGYCFIAPVERVEAEPFEPPRLVAAEKLGSIEEPGSAGEPRKAPQPRFFVVALLALTFLLTRGPRPGEPVVAPARTVRIAVAPLIADRTPVLDGRRLADELHSYLSRIQPQHIVVAADGPSDVRVETRLEEAEGSVRVHARLMEGGREVWAETIHRPAGDLTDLGLEVALRVTRGVAGRYVPPGRSEPLVRTAVSPRALALYREGRQVRNLPPPQRDLDRVLVLFQKAVELEPRFAEAWSGIGDVWSERAGAWTGESRAVALTQARIALERALALDPLCAEAQNDWGRLLMQHDRTYAAAEEALRRAIAADPQYIDAHYNLAVLLSAMGQHEKAVVELRRVQLLAPAAHVPSPMLAMLYMMAHRPADALAEYRAALLLSRNPLDLQWAIMGAAIAAGRWDDAGRAAARILEEPVTLDPSMADRGAAFRRELRRLEPHLLERERARRTDTYTVACFYAQLEEPDKAFAALNRAIANQSMPAIFAFVDPRLESLRADPRFAESVEKLGFRR